MRADSLYQYIVPLAFAAIWALTSLFNRETQPLPPRTNRPPGPPGPRPSPGAGSSSSATVRPAEWRPEPNAREAAARRAVGPESPGSMGGRTGPRRNDEILIIEADTKRPSAASPNGTRTGSSGSRRGGRTRPASQPSNRTSEPSTPRALTESLGRLSGPPAPLFTQASSLSPLSAPPSPLIRHPEGDGLRGQSGPAAVVTPQSEGFAATQIRLLMLNSARVREGFILNELLQPPVALRHGGLFSKRHG